MRQFRYKGINVERDMSVMGVIDANDRFSACMTLFTRGILPLGLYENHGVKETANMNDATTPTTSTDPVRKMRRTGGDGSAMRYILPDDSTLIEAAKVMKSRTGGNFSLFDAVDTLRKASGQPVLREYIHFGESVNPDNMLNQKGEKSERAGKRNGRPRGVVVAIKTDGGYAIGFCAVHPKDLANPRLKVSKAVMSAVAVLDAVKNWRSGDARVAPAIVGKVLNRVFIARCEKYFKSLNADYPFVKGVGDTCHTPHNVEPPQKVG